MPLKEYEIEVLKRLYDNDLILYKYLPIETVAQIIKWNKLSRDFNVKKKFKSVKKRLLARSYVYDAGKSCKVVSLSKYGIAYVEGGLTD